MCLRVFASLAASSRVVYVCVCVCVCNRKRERARERKRKRKQEQERESEGEAARERARERESENERARERESIGVSNLFNQDNVFKGGETGNAGNSKINHNWMRGAFGRVVHQTECSPHEIMIFF